MLEIQNLHASIEGKEILKGVNLYVERGQIHVIMGPNGGGKSTLASVLAGHPDYKVTQGNILLDNKMLLPMTPDERFHAGLFLSFQYPTEIPGVNLLSFIKQAVNTRQDKKGFGRIKPLHLRDVFEMTSKRLGFSDDLTKRFLNQGFSGGEKKRLEILQMALLAPDYVILDEPDSGLDVDALKLMAKEVLYQKQQRDFGLIIITHYARILEYIIPNAVHIMVNGQIVKHGNAGLAKEIEREGYEQFK